MSTASQSIHPTAVISDNVQLGKDSSVGAFCLIGENNQALVIGEKSNIRSHTVIYGGNTIGKNFQTGHRVMVREANTIGDDVSFGSGCNVEHHVTIGNHVRLHSQVFVPEFSTLEDHCWLGPCVVLTNARYPQSPNVKNELKGPHIKTYAKIGANSTILPGITIGKHALVGAGSVVTKDVPDYVVVAGNPAKVIGDVRQLPYDMDTLSK